MLCRGLTNLRDQHTTMEKQYKEKLRTLQAELAAVQEEQPVSPRTNNPVASSHDRPSPPHTGPSGRSRSDRSVHHSRPQSPHRSGGAITQPYSPQPQSQSSSSPRQHRDARRGSYSRTAEGFNSTSRPEGPRGSRSPSSSYPSSSSHAGFAVRSPRLTHASWGSPPHHHTEDVPTPTGSQHEPSLSPVASLIEPPSRPRSRKTRS